MSTPSIQDLQSYCQDVAERSRSASRVVAELTSDTKNEWLTQSAIRLRSQVDEVLEANRRDLARSAEFGLTPAQVDRLTLDERRVDDIADGLLAIAALDDPIGEVFESKRRPNGLQVSRVRVPLGVVFFVYESRPNVTVDAAAICLKSGNAVILRGGKEAAESSRAFIRILGEAANDLGVPRDALHLVETPDRGTVQHFLSMPDQIDVAIPRGGSALIRHVTEHAQMPVIKHFDGNCHVFVDRFADPDLAERIVVDSKCQRLGVCNACESLLLDRQLDAGVQLRILQALDSRGIEVRGDADICELFPDAVPASEDDFATEYLDAVISAAIVDTVDDAIEHIGRFGSGHTDAIVTNHLPHADRFSRMVDSAAVMVNASTRFHDGYQFGLGAEIGISTDRFHARGPCGLRELTTYKYVCHGQGQTLGEFGPPQA